MPRQIAYKQWDDKPTWCLDRGRDDHHNDPPDVPLGANAVSGFHAALVSHREKIAQMTDASVAFVTMKKTAGLMGTALKTMAAHPKATGAALGAGAGAMAGGPGHRMSGAAMGAGLGAAAGHGASKMPSMGGAAKAIPHPTPAAGAMAHGSGGMPKMTAPPGARTSGLSGPMPAGAKMPGAAAPAMPVGLANQSPQALSGARAEMAGGAPKGVGQAAGGGTQLGRPAAPAAQTQVMRANWSPFDDLQKHAGVFQRVINAAKSHPTVAMGVGGGALGAAAGATDDVSPLRGAAIGGLLGAGTGAGALHVGRMAGENKALKSAIDSANNRMSDIGRLGKPAMGKQASLPFQFAVDPSNAVADGGSSAFVKQAEVIGELAAMGAERIHPNPRFRFPTTAIIGAADDVAQVGRRKLQAEINRRSDPGHQQKMAFIGVGLKRGLQSAAGWGAAGAITGAATAQPGHRLRNAAVGGLAGAAGGAVAPSAEHYAGKLLKMATPYNESPLFDMKQRAADRFPEKVSPIEAIRTDFKSALHLLQDKVHELGSERLGLAQPKVAMQHVLQHDVPLNALEFRVHKIAADAGLDMREMAELSGMPRHIMTTRGIGAAGIGALIGGGMGYLGSKGRPEHGGRSNAEVALSADKAKHPEHPDGIWPTVSKHVTNMRADVAEQMRKHPVSATMIGGAAGAGLALRISRMLGK